MYIGSQDIAINVSEFDLPNQTSKFWHILTNVSGFNAYVSKPIFGLKPWPQAGRFECNKPINIKQNIFDQ